MRALVLVALGLSCAHVKAGDACKEADAHCQDAKTALICNTDGHLERLPCLGPKGCLVDKDRSVSCDQSALAAPASTCAASYEGKGQCGQTPETYLQCTSGTWVQLPCPQGQVCHDEAGKVFCE